MLTKKQKTKNKTLSGLLHLCNHLGRLPLQLHPFLTLIPFFVLFCCYDPSPVTALLIIL
jgi:hypothetical protein